jgi:glycosyltransferase involved in cell wall biosynthesis
MGGVETYARRLIPALLEERPDLEVTMFVNDAGHRLLRGEAWASSVEFSPHRLLGRPGVRAVGESFLLDRLSRRRGCQLLHSLGMTAPLRPGLPSVVTVPDVTWLRVPGAVPSATRILWKTLVVPAARRAQRVITHSRAARREISEDFRIAAERIDVIPHGPGGDVAEATSEARLRGRFALGDGPVVLAVSALLAHKNLPPLIEAMAIVRRDVPAASLVVPANPTPLQTELAALATQLEIPKAVLFPGWVSPSDLEGFYHMAACFAFPSVREGFGLPVLEAMRRGVPVACSNVSALPEVAGDAAMLFDPHRPGEIADAIRRLLTDRALAERLADRGRERARQFRWHRAASETLETYERALDAAGRQAHSTP